MVVKLGIVKQASRTRTGQAYQVLAQLHHIIHGQARQEAHFAPLAQSGRNAYQLSVPALGLITNLSLQQFDQILISLI